ncbi:MAG TPA: hemolysin III family protein [Candidatus Dormibacteraeota bacterium]|jgi:hemolysin III|nr:hemolysin III family protein [Candidatus Dormibacteraeota bacterium]
MVREASHAPEPQQTLGEEVANSVSHGVGLLAACSAIPLLITVALRRGTTSTIVGATVFATTIVLLYFASTLYHALPRNAAKRVFRILDYGAVFLLIAGTYTPFTLGVLRGAWGWTLLGLVWTLAVLGVVLTAVGGVRYPRLSTAVYVGMGWLILIAIRPLWLRVPAAGLIWLLAGGIAYTAGVAFLTAKRVRYGHFIWHLFVLIGSTCHFIAVLSYAA